MSHKRLLVLGEEPAFVKLGEPWCYNEPFFLMSSREIFSWSMSSLATVDELVQATETNTFTKQYEQMVAEKWSVNHKTRIPSLYEREWPPFSSPDPPFSWLRDMKRVRRGEEKNLKIYRRYECKLFISDIFICIDIEADQVEMVKK